jgi:CelD/BcsL family acetyltransferase involved in cellulose biosynthesis
MGELVVEAVTGGLSVFDRLGDEWREFLDRVETDPPYWRPEWIAAALRAYSPKANVIILTVRQQGSLCAVLPLVEEKSSFAGLPARKLRAPLTTAGVGVDILCSVPSPARAEVIAALWEALKKRKWDVMELPSVFEQSALEELYSLAQKDGHATGNWALPLIAYFSIPVGPTAEKDLEKYPRHPKLRSKVRQRETKLAALGKVHLRRTENHGIADLQSFYEMEAAGWKGKEKSAIISDPRSRQFFDEVVNATEHYKQLCLYTLLLDEKPIAAHIGMTYRGRYWAAKSTYDENYRDYAPGHVIVKAILRDCSARGVSEYIMGVREDWKMEWTQDVRKRNYLCIFNRGLWARLLYAVRFPLRQRAIALRAKMAAKKSAPSQQEVQKQEAPKNEAQKSGKTANSQKQNGDQTQSS